MTYLSMKVRLILLYSVFLQLSKCNNVYDEIDAKILSDVLLNKDVEIFNERAMANIVTRINQLSYGIPDQRVGLLLAQLTPDSLVNPEQLGPYFEGDILNPITDSHDFDRNGIIGQRYRWPGGIVYYKYDAKFDESQKNLLQKAMKAIEDETCIKFKMQTKKDKHYVSITSDNSGCWSSIGRQGGRQRTNLSPDCFNPLGTIIHEFLHVIGFDHEHNRTDRDDFVTIVWKNIAAGDRRQYQKRKLNPFGVPYDYGSIMHYDKMGLGINFFLPTIIPKKQGVVIGQREKLSQSDILKIRAMYKCNEKVAGV